MTDPLRAPHVPLDRATRLAIAETVPVPHAMPSQPFGRVRALWLCRHNGCAEWNAPDRAHCRTCRSPRSEL
jgi:hypothetical protein